MRNLAYFFHYPNNRPMSLSREENSGLLDNGDDLLKRDILRNGKFNYRQTFNTFVSSTPQKEDTAKVMGDVAYFMKENGINFSNQTEINVGDFGCADAKTGVQLLNKMMKHFNTNNNNNNNNISQSADVLQNLQNYRLSSNGSRAKIKVNYLGIDLIGNFFEEATKNLSRADDIKKFTLIHGSALDGNVSKRKEFIESPIHILLFLHTGYYLGCKQSAYEKFMKDMHKVLKKDQGIAFCAHEKSGTLYFRQKYNQKKFGDISTSMFLEICAAKQKGYNQSNSIEFTSQLNFQRLPNDLWEAMKNPKRYAEFARELDLADRKNFIETLEKLAFIVHRPLGTMSKTNLINFIEEIKAVLEANNHCLDITTSLLTIVGPECTQEYRKKVSNALQQTKKKISFLPQKASSPITITENTNTMETETPKRLARSQSSPTKSTWPIYLPPPKIK